MVAALLCAGFIEAAHAAELITLRYGQNAASSGRYSRLTWSLTKTSCPGEAN